MFQAVKLLMCISHIIAMVGRVARRTLSCHQSRMLAWQLARTSSIWASDTLKVLALLPVMVFRIVWCHKCN